MPAPNASLPERLRKGFGNVLHFLTSALFINNLLALLGATFFMLLFVIWWLRCYTQHGEQHVVENYVGALFEDADRDARGKDFRLVREDSVFVVGKAGGTIITQNPVPGSRVKEGRRVYVTVAKHLADEIPFASLPAMYGQEVNGVRKSLKQRFHIESEILAEVFDEGPPNVVLAVLYGGDTLVSARRRPVTGSVAKGATLQLIVSKDVSESVLLPDLVCKSYSQAEFVVNANRLQFGQISLDDGVTDKYRSWVYRQDPPYLQGARLDKGDTIAIWLAPVRPARCPVETDPELD